MRIYIFIIAGMCGLISLSSCSKLQDNGFTSFSTATLTPTITFPTFQEMTNIPAIETPNNIIASIDRSGCEQILTDLRSSLISNQEQDFLYPYIPIVEKDSISLDKVVVALYCQYLDSYMSLDTETHWRIVDYKIEIRPANFPRDRDELLFHASFYVLPFDPMKTYWRAGAATFLEEGWILSSIYSSIEISEEYYRITGFFNG
jgi:hypothetical protein